MFEPLDGHPLSRLLLGRITIAAPRTTSTTEKLLDVAEETLGVWHAVAMQL
jgi:hypothetical protein